MAPINQVLTEYDLRMVLSLWKRDIMLSLNCHAVGTIQEFDSTLQTAQVSINYKQVYSPTSPTLPDQLVAYPLLLDCPVVIMNGGGGRLTFPIKKGDECIVLFNDRDIDTWFAGNTGGAPNSSRTHSFSDGLVLVGVKSNLTKLSDYSTTHVELSHSDGGSLKLSDKVRLENNITDLKAVINGLIDIIAGLTTIPIPPTGLPSGATLGPSDIISLNNYKTTVGNLLE